MGYRAMPPKPHHRTVTRRINKAFAPFRRTGFRVPIRSTTNRRTGVKSLVVRHRPPINRLNMFGRTPSQSSNRQRTQRRPMRYKPLKSAPLPKPIVVAPPQTTRIMEYHESFQPWGGFVASKNKYGVRNLRKRAKTPRPATPAPPPPPPSMGLKLERRLQAAKGTMDLFNKKLREWIVTEYILKNEGLRCMGSGFKTAKDFQEIPFPDRLLPVFAISIKPERYKNLMTRMRSWGKHVQLWEGTNGKMLDKQQLLEAGLLRFHEFRKGEMTLRRGEIGCYDSHVRLWKHIVENNIPQALILEDDANIAYSQETVDRMERLFRDIDRLDLKFDLIYLGHNDFNPSEMMIEGTELGIPTKCQGLFTYLVSLEGARKLLEIALPMGAPIDIHIMDMCNYIKQYSLEPRLN